MVVPQLSLLRFCQVPLVVLKVGLNLSLRKVSSLPGGRYDIISGYKLNSCSPIVPERSVLEACSHDHSLSIRH